MDILLRFGQRRRLILLMVTYPQQRIGLWFMMATIQGFWRHYFWSIIKIDPFKASPYHINDIPPWTHFDETIKALNFTNVKPPA